MDLEITLPDLEHVLEGNNVAKDITTTIAFDALCEEHEVKISAGANVLYVDTYNGGEERELSHEIARDEFVTEKKERPDYSHTPELWGNYIVSTLIRFFDEKSPNYIIKAEIELYNVCRKATSIRLNISYR